VFSENGLVEGVFEMIRENGGDGVKGRGCFAVEISDNNVFDGDPAHFRDACI